MAPSEGEGMVQRTDRDEDGPKGQLNRNPLDFIQSNLILPPVVELRRAR